MPCKTWKAWTTNDERTVETMRLDGASTEQIAAAVGHSVAGVKCKLAELDAPLVRRRTAQWIALLAEPIPLKDAALLMGVSIGAVKQMKRKLRRAGVEVADLPRANQYGPWKSHRKGVES